MFEETLVETIYVGMEKITEDEKLEHPSTAGNADEMSEQKPARGVPKPPNCPPPPDLLAVANKAKTPPRWVKREDWEEVGWCVARCGAVGSGACK